MWQLTHSCLSHHKGIRANRHDPHHDPHHVILCAKNGSAEIMTRLPPARPQPGKLRQIAVDPSLWIAQVWRVGSQIFRVLAIAVSALSRCPPSSTRQVLPTEFHPPSSSIAAIALEPPQSHE
jgi:hypothetical protein